MPTGILSNYYVRDIQNKMAYKVVGLDLSFTSTGVCVIVDEDVKEAYAVQAGSPKSSFFTRLNAVWSGIERALDPKPDMVVIEGAAYGAIFKAFDLGQLNGVIKYKLAALGIPYIEIPPKAARKIVLDRGDLTKEQVASEVESKFGYKNNVLDIIDAFVVAKAFILGYSLKKKVKKTVKRIKKVKNGEIGVIV